MLPPITNKQVRTGVRAGKLSDFETTVGLLKHLFTSHVIEFVLLKVEGTVSIEEYFFRWHEMERKKRFMFLFLI